MTWLFIVLSGLLMSFAHPFRANDFTREGSWLWIAFASLGLAIFIYITTRERTNWKRFVFGFVGAFVYFILSLYWIVIALHQYGELPIWVAVIIAVLLSGYCAAFWGGWALLAGSPRLCDKSEFIKILLWASAFAGVEVLREYLFTGLNWAELGFAFSFSPWLAKTSALWGVHGLTFIWVFTVATILTGNDWYYNLTARIQFSVFFLLLIALGVFTAYQPFQTKEFELKKIALIQPNISQDIKWNPHKAREHLKDLVELTNKATSSDPELIVWPETAYPYLIGGDQKLLPLNFSTPVLFGSVIRDGDVNKNAALLAEENQILGRFEKIHLVPFGEYVPLASILPFGKLVANVGNFESGSKDQPLLTPVQSNLQLGPLICYEDIFSRGSVHLARKGANLLVNITNDAWYGKSSALAQHAAMAAFQVYQTRLPMVRATNTGLSSFIWTEGRIDKPPFEQGVFVETIPIPIKPIKTFFVWTYPLMELIWFGILIIGIAWKSEAQRKKMFYLD